MKKSFAVQLQRASRQWHRQVSLIIALPILVTLTTGVLLMLRGQFHFIQPASQMGQMPLTAPVVSANQILEQLQTLPEAEVNGWQDVSSLIFSPAKGTYQARLKNNYLVQFDAQNGQILDINYRLTNVLIALHQGTFFHKKAMLWIFFPASVGLWFLWLSGMYLAIYPQIKRRKKHVKPSTP